MLTQERLVEIHVLETQGLSIRAIGRKLGVSRNTVRKAVFTGPMPKTPIPMPRG